MSIPGIKNLGAQAIASEIGIDMSRFPSDAPARTKEWAIRLITQAGSSMRQRGHYG
jgi:transposase